MRHANRMSNLFIFLLLCAAAFAQTSQKSTPRPTPEPDFSRVPDPTSQTMIRYHQYDKALITFRTSAQYVVVPVIVTDKHDRPVPGLTKENFRLQENGKEQKITSLEEFNSPSAKSTSENSVQATTQNTPRQLIIIALDTVNTPIDDQERARRQLISYLTGSVEPDSQYELVAVANNGLQILHDVTQDTAALVAALNTVGNRFPTTNKEDQALLRKASGPDVGATTSNMNLSSDASTAQSLARGEQAYAQARQVDAAGSTLLAFQQIAEHVSKVPGRKSLVWVTGGFPFSIDPHSASVNVEVSFADYQHTMHLLSSQMISVYPVDARGVLTLGPDATSSSINEGNALPNNSLPYESNRQRNILDTMRAFSEMTGGQAYLNRNNISEALRAAARDGSAYYLVSYPVDQSDRRQGWRKITVKVGNNRVRARKGYLLTQVTADSTDL